MTPKITFHMGGALGKKYGRAPIPLDVPDIRMGVELLCSRFGPAFRNMIKTGEWHLSKKPLKDCMKGETISEEEVPFGQRDGTHIYINPKMRAHGRNGWSIVAGIVLVIAGFFTAGATWGGAGATFGATFGAAGGIGGIVGSALVGIGASIAIGGIMSALAPKPKIDKPREQAGSNPSYMFNGTVNVTEQGGPVPIIYGRVTRASSLVASAGITTERLPPEVNASAG